MPQPTNVDIASNVPPVSTKTWFHTGAYFGEGAISDVHEQEYYAEGDPATGVAGLNNAQLERLLLDDTVLPIDILLPDGTRLPMRFSRPRNSGRPAGRCAGRCCGRRYTRSTGPAPQTAHTACPNATTRSKRSSPKASNQYGVFFTHPRETVDFHYERQLYTVSGDTIVRPGARARRPTRGSATH